MSLTILNPVSQAEKTSTSLADRLDTLEGKRVGCIWNGRRNGDKIIKATLEVLKEKWHIEVVDILKKPYIGNVAPEEMFDRIISQKIDFAITGVGD